MLQLARQGNHRGPQVCQHYPLDPFLFGQANCPTTSDITSASKNQTRTHNFTGLLKAGLAGPCLWLVAGCTPSNSFPNTTSRSNWFTASRAFFPSSLKRFGSSYKRRIAAASWLTSPVSTVNPELCFRTKPASSDSMSAEINTGFDMAIIPSNLDGKNTSPVPLRWAIKQS